MLTTMKVLGQAALAALALTPVYTVPGATQTISSSIVIANRSAVATTYRVSVAVAGAVDDAKQYVAYDIALPGNTTHALNLGITLGAGDVVRAYANDATVTVSVFGNEVS